MRIFPKSTGNWAEDLGADIEFMLKAALYGIPFLVLVIVLLILALVFK